MRLRCTSGLKLLVVHGNCVYQSNSIITFPVVSRGEGISIELDIEPETVVETSVVLQIGFVFTDSFAQRRIRVFTFSAASSAEPMIVLHSIDQLALFSLLARKFVSLSFTVGPIAAAEQLSRSATHLLVQGCQFQYLPHLLHALLANSLAQPTFPTSFDGRTSELIFLRALRIFDLILYFYPRLIAADGDGEILPLTGASFARGSCFIVHTVRMVVIWVSKGATQGYLESVFGVDQVEALPQAVPETGTAENLKVNELIRECWALSGRYLPVEVIGQGSEREVIFRDILVDDALVAGANFLDWMRQFR
jgi:hypothetical protein